MFQPNSKCQLFRRKSRDRHAQAAYADGVDIGYSPVRLLSKTEKSSVRADSSASRGQAEFEGGVFKILVDKSVASIRSDDRIDLDGVRYRVINIHPRYRVMGGLDHFEVDMEPLS